PGGDAFEVHAVDLDERDEFEAPHRADGWRAFVRGTIAELRAAGHDVQPARLTIEGDLPQGSGLSSSAALEAALCLALTDIDPTHADRVELAKLCSRVENDWVGARTGLLDQLAVLCGEDGHALRIDFRTLDIRPVPLELGDWTLVTLDSGASHEHAGGGYNERRAETDEARELLGLDSLRDAAAETDLPEPLNRRVRHIVTENARVEATIAALHAHDLHAVGELLDASHASLRDDYEASVPAVEATVTALKDAGAAGARMVGGGFGGSVLALLPPGAARLPGTLVVTPGPAARRL
ncbi:MAG: galactokinase, partial [Blastocatellia bacterium]|nr:galactokinase [Blastocatellia bacterium]